MKKNISFNIVLLALFSSLTSSAEDLSTTTTLESRFSVQAIDRPSTMPVGIVSINSGFNLTKYKTLNWDIGTNFGIIKNLEASLSYDGVTFNEPKTNKAAAFGQTLTVGAKYSLPSVDHVSISVGAKMPFNFFAGEIVRDIKFGLPTVFYNSVLAGGILDDVITLTMRPNVEVEFNFDWWFGYQVYGNLWADISSSFGQLKMNNPENQASWDNKAFWQKLPAKLSVLYGFNEYFDLTANFGFDDLFYAKDTMKFGLGFNLRGGKLFG